MITLHWLYSLAGAMSAAYADGVVPPMPLANAQTAQAIRYQT